MNSIIIPIVILDGKPCGSIGHEIFNLKLILNLNKTIAQTETKSLFLN